MLIDNGHSLQHIYGEISSRDTKPSHRSCDDITKTDEDIRIDVESNC